MKKNSILLFILLVMTMSSCVYSLFPIYTEDTLVFKKELLGKWSIGSDPEDYLLFESTAEEEEAEEKPVYQDSLITEDYAIRTGDQLFITVDGKKIYDKDSIKEALDARLKNTAVVQESKKERKAVSFEGSIEVYEEKSYKLTVVENGERQHYIAHMVELGDDYFLDLYPGVEVNTNDFSWNYFPVHTFMKVSVEDDRLELTPFDLDKLNKLFESNLIRIRHESVDGNILITAQPKEIQKFLSNYSDDASVFEKTETHFRILP